MVQKYHTEISHIAEDYMQWFTKITCSLFCKSNDDNSPPKAISLPPSFTGFMEQEALSPSMSSEVMQSLEHLYADLQKQTEYVSSSPDSYKRLASSYENFLRYLIRLSGEGDQENSSLDLVTGLRNAKNIKEDMRRELERLLRHGKEFSLVLLRIDNFKKMEQELNMNDLMNILQAVSKGILKSLRSFDDAYYLGNGEILLSLKQTKMPGGKQMLRRLRKDINDVAPEGTAKIPFSASIAEPAPRENIKKLIDHLREDLCYYKEKGSVIAEHSSLSPLQRYAEAQK